jgi:acetyl esterase/lipase
VIAFFLGVALAQDLPQLEPGPYDVGVWDWDWDAVETTNPDTGRDLDADNYGRLVYPTNPDGSVAEGPFPVVVFGHGRFHSGPTLYFNHLEAGYLLERLASWGIIATSVNLDVVGEFSFPAAIPQRGDIIRKTLERTYDLDSQPGSPPAGLAAAVDDARAVIIGHSRGGEGSVAAAVQNELAGSPLPIVGVATIAPTDFEDYELGDIPYMGIYGSKDGDVSTGSPIIVHDRATSATKLFHYIHGANHFWFTETINYSGEGDADITRDLHHDLAMGYLAGFAYRQLYTPDEPSSVFVGPEMDPLTDEADILSMYRDPDRFVVDAFEIEGSTATTDLGLRVFQKRWDYLAEPYINDSGRTLYHLTDALEVTWDSGSPHWAAGLPGSDFDATAWDYVSLKMAQLLDSPLNVAGRDQDVTIGMRDTDGDFAFVRLSDYGRIDYPVTHEGGWYETFPEKTVLHTTRIPLSAFEAANPAIDLDHLTGVGFRADLSPSGRLFVDDVEFTQ